MVSRYTALRKYPQWHVFGDENVVQGLPPSEGEKRSNKATENLIIGVRI